MFTDQIRISIVSLMMFLIYGCEQYEPLDFRPEYCNCETQDVSYFIAGIALDHHPHVRTSTFEIEGVFDASSLQLRGSFPNDPNANIELKIATLSGEAFTPGLIIDINEENASLNISWSIDTEIVDFGKNLSGTFQVTTIDVAKNYLGGTITWNLTSNDESHILDAVEGRLYIK